MREPLQNTGLCKIFDFCHIYKNMLVTGSQFIKNISFHEHLRYIKYISFYGYTHV